MTTPFRNVTPNGPGGTTTLLLVLSFTGFLLLTQAFFVVPAGQVSNQTVTPGSAIRIMTGAPVPNGADTVIPFEETDELGGTNTEDNVGVGLSSEIYENANLTINWESSEDFDGNETDTVAVELSVSF